MPKKKKKKKKGNGHRIGGMFENKVKNIIVDCFADFGISPQDAFRSEKSGAGKNAYGDISLSPALAKLFPYAVECKHWARIDLYQLMVPWPKMGKVNKFKEWWKQTLEGAAKCTNLYPLLVFRSKGQPIMCMLYSHHFYSVLNMRKNYFRKKRIAVLRAHHSDGELFCFRFDVLIKLLHRKHKKGLSNGQVYSDKGSGVRLRSQGSKTRKQMCTASRPQRQAASKHIRTTAESRSKHRNGAGLRRSKKISNGAS